MRIRTSIQNAGSLPNESVNNTKSQVRISKETSHDYSNIYMLKQASTSVVRFQPNLSQTPHIITPLMAAVSDLTKETDLSKTTVYYCYFFLIHKNCLQL